MLGVWYWWEPKLPQVQPECAVESGPKQSAFQQTDTPIKTCSVRGLLRCLPALNRAQERGACRLSLLPFRISARPFRHAKTTSPFPSQWHTHTQSPPHLVKAAEATFCLGRGVGWVFLILCAARLAQVEARESRAQPPLRWSSQPLMNTFYLTVLCIYNSLSVERLSHRGLFVCQLHSSIAGLGPAEGAGSRAHVKTGSQFWLVRLFFHFFWVTFCLLLFST